MEKISICICTRNRVNDLKSAISSIRKSSYTNYELIVSDDSTNNDTWKMIKSDFHEVKYLKGPQKGLCWNRNNTLNSITGSRVLFMDDDVIMSKDFLQVMMDRLLQLEPKTREKTIITGLEMNRGNLVHPNKISFLGHQKKAYKHTESLKTIIINSTLFPISLLEEIKFDEHLVYGYDEVDIAARAVSAGYNIILCKEAINEHYPSSVNRDYYSLYIEASRIYVTYKRYKEIEKKKLKSLAYLSISFVHMLVFQVNHKKIKGFISTISTFKKAYSYIKLANNKPQTVYSNESIKRS